MFKLFKSPLYVFGIALVCFPTSILGHSVHVLLPHLGHVAQNSKDDETRQKAGQTVHRAGDQSVPEMEKGDSSQVRVQSTV